MKGATIQITTVGGGVQRGVLTKMRMRNEWGTPAWDIGDGRPGEVITAADFSHGEDFASFMADVARTELAKIARAALADAGGETT